MNPLAGLLAPALAVLPVALSGSADAGADLAEVSPAAELTPSAAASPQVERDEPGPWRSFEQAARALREAAPAEQVRIEQRVIIRIAPGATRPPPSVDPRRALLSPFPTMARGPRTIERRTAQCLPVGAIAGVQPDGSRLLLFMRDQRILSATLEKGCNARDYYSGFLVERTSDGMLCAGRDKLLARSGANCGMGKLSQVVVLDDEE
jgi:hypothetical protein